jgi:hypothetical protein
LARLRVNESVLCCAICRGWRWLSDIGSWAEVGGGSVISDIGSWAEVGGG